MCNVKIPAFTVGTFELFPLPVHLAVCTLKFACNPASFSKPNFK